jgi:hypothetical protein
MKHERDSGRKKLDAVASRQPLGESFVKPQTLEKFTGFSGTFRFENSVRRRLPHGSRGSRKWPSKLGARSRIQSEAPREISARFLTAPSRRSIYPSRKAPAKLFRSAILEYSEPILLKERTGFRGRGLCACLRECHLFLRLPFR